MVHQRVINLVVMWLRY